LGEFIKQFNAENSAPIGFHVTSMTAFGWQPDASNIWDQENERQLRNIVTEYRKSSSILDEAKAIIAKQDVLAGILDQTSIDQIESQIGNIDKYMTTLAGAFKSCKDSKACAMPPQPYPDNLLPSLPQRPSGELLVMVDNVLWDPVRSAAIITNDGPLLDKVKIYDPSARNAQIVLKIDGNYIGAVKLGVRYYNGRENDAALLDPSKTVYLLCDSEGEAEFGFPCHFAKSGVLANEKFVAALLETLIGTETVIYVRATDRLGRTTSIDVLSIKIIRTPKPPPGSTGFAGFESHWLGGLTTP
jgi:hypothetical protein